MSFAEMDAAAKLAHEDLAKLRDSATEEQRTGIDLFVAWIKKWKQTAGYKRLVKPLVNK